ncbi:MAG: MOP flippase family protein [Candidatus Methanoperedens sp.]|nr:MOP flippase family protein [Candidatus Methanoperedens sp.]
MVIEQKFISGVKWSAISRIALQITQILITVILARLLVPDDFGLLGMAVVFTSFVTIFNDFGIGSAIIQKQNLNNKQLSSIFLFNILIGFFMVLISIIAAPIIAEFFNQPLLTSVIYIMSLSFIFISVCIVKNSLLIKDFNFKKITFLELFSTIFSGVFGIILAFMGYGVWSLVWQNVSMNFIYAILLWSTHNWMPEIYFNWRDIRSIIGFSSNLSGFNLLNYFSRNADRLLIGKFLGMTALGYYNFAYTLMLYPLSNISSVLSRVMFPALSQIQHDNAKFRLFFLKSTKYIAFISFPMMLGLFALADEFILTIFGEKWSQVILLIKILSIVGLIQSIESTVGTIYLSKGRTGWMFLWGIFESILVVGTIVISLRWGINGVVIGYAIVNVFLAYFTFAIPFKLIDLKVIDLILSLKNEIATSLIMFFVIIIFTSIQRYYLLPGNIILLSGISIGALTYFIATIKLNNTTYRELKSHILSGVK